MLEYRSDLKKPARRLRAEMTDSEQRLWSRLRRKQLLGVQFYRQRPIGDYIVDFLAPAARLVVEVEGSQHMVGDQSRRDLERDRFLVGLGLKVMRFYSSEVLSQTDSVVQAIFDELSKSHPASLCEREGRGVSVREREEIVVAHCSRGGQRN